MSATFDQAAEDMFKLVNDAAVQANVIAAYPSMKFDVPTTQVPWTRTTLKHNSGGQSSLAGGIGQVKYSRSGTLWIQTFWPLGSGLTEQLALCQKFVNAFQNVRTVHGVWFHNHRVREVGQDGEFYNINVLIDFEYEQIQ